MQVETLRRQAPVQRGKPVGPAEDVGIVAQVQDQGMFPVGSDQLTPDGRRQVEKLAQVFRQQLSEGGSSRALLVVGHRRHRHRRIQPASFRTAGSHRWRGVGSGGDQSIDYLLPGCGCFAPIADNRTKRRQNRRVEIVEVASTEILKQRVAEEQSNPVILRMARAPIRPTSPCTLKKETSEAGKRLLLRSKRPPLLNRKPLSPNHRRLPFLRRPSISAASRHQCRLVTG